MKKALLFLFCLTSLSLTNTGFGYCDFGDLNCAREADRRHQEYSDSLHDSLRNSVNTDNYYERQQDELRRSHDRLRMLGR